MTTITAKHEMTNTTDRWLVVGNYHEILSAHRTFESAVAALNAIGSDGPDGLAGTRWFTVVILAPSKTISGETSQSLPMDEQDEAATIAANKAAMIEMFGTDFEA